MTLPTHPVSHPLVQAWSDYKSEVLSARQKANPKNIHALRVSTQRLEAILRISQGLMWSSAAKRLMKAVSKTRKRLGPLRDLQVEIEVMEHGSKRFSRFMRAERKKEKESAGHYLRHISLKRERNLVKGIMSKKFIAHEQNMSREKIQDCLTQGVQPTYRKFYQALERINPEKAKSIHHFRCLAKQLRYQEEAIQKVSGASPLILPLLKTVQSEVGNLQDARVLIDWVKHYLSHKKHKDDQKMTRFQKILKRNLKTNVAQENHHLIAIRREAVKWKN